MMGKILVSILVPVYNTSPYLEKCLDTLIAQTLKEIEIICVNDGSTDHSLEILQAYAKKDPRIIIVDKPNGGLPSARNAGIDRATGEYVGFVDSDDYVEPTMFEKLYRTAIKRQSEVVICGAQIFPTDPAPSQWLCDVLSPRSCHYATYTPDILFRENGSRPFIWRNLIKRDLLEREGIRLREDIVLGEDQALQFKVYPKAKGITFIPDKLYHYCWYRQGSIMNADSTKKFAQRVEKHANLCVHVMETVKQQTSYESMQRELLIWGVELLYDDFIKLSYRDRHRIAKRLCAAWNSFGYWEYHSTFAPHINDMFRYFYRISESPEPSDVRASIVVNLYNSKDSFPEFKDSILRQTLQELEIIFINNASDNDTYLHLHRWLMSDVRVRVINQGYDSIASTFGQGLQLAVGEAIVFADAHDVLSSDTALQECCDALRAADADVVVSGTDTCKKESLSDYRLYDFLFRRAYLIDRELEFGDFSRMTTRSFATRALANAEKLAFHEGEALFRHRSLWRRDWLHTWEARNVLLGYCDMLEQTSEARMANEHLRLLDEINSDATVQLICNATNPYLMPEKACPNGENSQGEIFKLICALNRAVDFSLIGNRSGGALKLLGEFVNRRHVFLTQTMHF